MDKSGNLLHMMANLQCTVDVLNGTLSMLSGKLNGNSSLSSEDREQLAECVQYILAVEYYTKNVKSRLKLILGANKLFFIK